MAQTFYGCSLLDCAAVCPPVPGVSVEGPSRLEFDDIPSAIEAPADCETPAPGLSTSGTTLLADPVIAPAIDPPAACASPAPGASTSGLTVYEEYD